LRGITNISPWSIFCPSPTSPTSSIGFSANYAF
jgi:hypothetical protein